MGQCVLHLQQAVVWHEGNLDLGVMPLLAQEVGLRNFLCVPEHKETVLRCLLRYGSHLFVCLQATQLLVTPENEQIVRENERVREGNREWGGKASTSWLPTQQTASRRLSARRQSKQFHMPGLNISKLLSSGALKRSLKMFYPPFSLSLTHISPPEA